MPAQDDIFSSFSIEITVFLITHFLITSFCVLLNTQEKNRTLRTTGSFNASTRSKHTMASCYLLLTIQQTKAMRSFYFASFVVVRGMRSIRKLEYASCSYFQDEKKMSIAFYTFLFVEAPVKSYRALRLNWMSPS